MCNKTDTQRNAEFVKAFDAGTDGMPYLSSGFCPDCPECASNHGLTIEEAEEAYEEGRICDEGNFSWHDCKLCGSSLGGSRYTIHYRDKNNSLIHLDGACSDCIVYMEIGDLLFGD